MFREISIYIKLALLNLSMNLHFQCYVNNNIIAREDVRLIYAFIPQRRQITQFNRLRNIFWHRLY